MYENLELKNEFMDAIRNYSILVFLKGDLNKIKDLFMRFSMLDITQKENQAPQINQLESVNNMVCMLDTEICKLQGIDPNYITQLKLLKKQRSKIISEVRKTFCGVEKE